MDDAAVVGYGTVGQATAKVFGIKKHFDIDESKSNVSLKEVARCRFIFLALPTPTKNGRCDVSKIEGIVRQIADYGCGGILVSRSTVTPGTARNLAEKYRVPIVANPEFLTESTAEYDAKHPDIIVIGADNLSSKEAVRGLYEARFKGVDIIETDTITAETIKYAVNTFYATKVIFANEIYDICQRIGANYETIKDAMYKRRWIGKNHLTVQHKGGRGAKGKCLGKDLEAFASFSNSKLLKLVQDINSRFPEKDG